MFRAKTVENFLDTEEVEYLLNFVRNTNMWSNAGHEFWDGRVINYEDVFKVDIEAAKILLKANMECSEKIIKEYNLSEPIYSDTLQLVRWFPGMKQSPHSDDMKNTGTKGHEHRAFGSIVYLNDNYSGGRTYYPNFEVEIIPERGKLAFHPGDLEHLHGVTEIQEEIRYTISSFWTFDSSFSHEWSCFI